MLGKSGSLLLTMLTVVLLVCISTQCARADDHPFLFNEDVAYSRDTLYKEDPLVEDLIGSNISRKIAQSNIAWVIQIYAIGCSQCQRFAPRWTEFARDVREWRKLIRVAAIPCSHPNNTVTCRELEVINMPMPITLFFPPKSAEDFRGHILYCPDSLSVNRQCIVEMLEGVVHKPHNWPRLDRFTNIPDVVKYIRRSVSHRIKKHLIMFDLSPSDFDRSFIGREVILDMNHHHRELLIVRMIYPFGQNYGVTVIPSLYQLNEDQSLTLIAANKTRHEFSKIIKRDVLHLPVKDDGHVIPTTEKPPEKQLQPDGVHMLDLESGIYYSMWEEIPKKETISGKSFEALKDYLKVLAKLLPIHSHGKKFISRIHDIMLSYNGSISRDTWVNQITVCRTYKGYIPRRVIWKGCLGSEPHYRGYLCSFWTIFHTLTVAAANSTMHGGDISPKDVLLTMRDYVKHFLSCAECRESFMKSEKIDSIVTNSVESGVLYLWKMHNTINLDLHGDPETEDPRHPKAMFPSYSACKSCYHVPPESPYQPQQWTDGGVLDYLMSYYGAHNIIVDEVPFIFHNDAPYYVGGVATISQSGSSFIVFTTLIVSVVMGMVSS